MSNSHAPLPITSVQGTSAIAGWSSFEIRRWGREIIRREGEALLTLADQLGPSFVRAVELIDRCAGTIVVCGMGKAGLVGQKISATLCSTGTRSIFLHPAEAIHGDLGRLQAGDVVLMLSQSGETDEITRLLPSIAALGNEIVAVTAQTSSTLGKASTITLELGQLDEAGPNGLAPSTSTTAMMAIGDALALVVSRQRGFAPQDFARYHPGGSLGLKLSTVDDVMRPLAECRIASQSHRVRDVFVEASRPGRRSGAIMLHDDDGRLTGLFTDSDLARLLEHRQDDALDAPMQSVMTAAPTTVSLGTPLPEAVELLAAKKISELPIVDPEGKPAGMLDITDVVALLPTHSSANEPPREGEPTTIPFKS